MSTATLPGEGSVSVRLWLGGDEDGAGKDGMAIRRAEVATRRPRAVACALLTDAEALASHGWPAACGGWSRFWTPASPAA